MAGRRIWRGRGFDKSMASSAANHLFPFCQRGHCLVHHFLGYKRLPAASPKQRSFMGLFDIFSSNQTTMSCSFCGKPHTGVLKLIASQETGVNICDSCVGVCAGILRDELRSNSPKITTRSCKGLHQFEMMVNAIAVEGFDVFSTCQGVDGAWHAWIRISDGSDHSRLDAAMERASAAFDESVRSVERDASGEWRKK